MNGRQIDGSGYRTKRAVARLASGVLALLLACLPGAVAADELPVPTGRVILSVSGSIARTNAPGRADFDRSMLTALGLVERTIDTPWTDAGTRFEGVPAPTLMAHVGATGRWVEAVAANDYRVEIPLVDLTDHATLFALSKDGRTMRLRDKGPVWLLYENRDRPDVDEDELIARMVWQLRTLEVVE